MILKPFTKLYCHSACEALGRASLTMVNAELCTTESLRKVWFYIIRSCHQFHGKLPWHCLNKWLILFLHFQHPNLSSMWKKKINLLDASLSHILPLTHTGHPETAAAGQANQEWCKDYSSSGDTSGKWVGFQWSCSDSLLPHIERLFSASTVFLKPNVISARCPMLFKLSMNNYRWLHSTPLERCDDFVFANVSFSISWTPTGARWRPRKSTQRLHGILLRATKAVSFIWIVSYAHYSAPHYLWKANTKRMPLRFVCYYVVITVWDIVKGHEVTGFLSYVGERVSVQWTE